MSDERKFKFSYRLFIKEEGQRNAVQLTTKLTEGEPVTIEEAEVAIKKAVERLIEGIV